MGAMRSLNRTLKKLCIANLIGFVEISYQCAFMSDSCLEMTKWYIQGTRISWTRK